MIYGEKSKQDLDAHALELFKGITVKKRSLRKKLYDDLLDWFNMPTSVAEEMITLKRDIKEFTPFEVFCLVYFLDRDSLKKYFTADEIDALSKEKFVEEKASFPLVFDNMVQVADDQWIGKTTVKQIMQLKRSRMLNYDENEQRALKRIRFGNVEIFKPFVSNKNVREIKAAMENGTYIPDPITLNMPDGSEYSFDDHTLTIYSLPKGMFNLDDGYHRYLAMSQIFDFDKSFDYPMELRIVNFPNSKANSFIFQQDQKTPMKKIVSATYDVNAIPNRIVARINQDPMCNYQNAINRNDGVINSAVFARMVQYFYVQEKPEKGKEAAFVSNVHKELVEKLNSLSNKNEKYMEKISEPELLIAMYLFKSDLPQDKYAEEVEAIYSTLSDSEKKIFTVSNTGTVRKRAINIIKERKS